MPVSDAVKNHFGAELDHGDPQPLCLPSHSPAPVLQSHSGSVDLEQCSSEENLGCARGVMWALIFQAALVIAAAAVYSLFHLSR